MSEPGRTKENPKRPAAETDPRFPSGPWVGFWVQRGMGKQRMSLWLAFAEGRVTGGGRDVIGPFSLLGAYDLKSGVVRMLKQYDGAHRVAYEGANQGDGLWLWGLWTLGVDRGGFHLWPEGEEDPTQRRTRAEREQPAGPQRRRLKPGELLPL